LEPRRDVGHHWPYLLHLRSPGPRGPITIDCPRNDPQSIAFAFRVEHHLHDCFVCRDSFFSIETPKRFVSVIAL
jgi:hypothetical protein